MMHCGKHDKLYDENNPCPGCVTEAASHAAVIEKVSAGDSDAKEALTKVAALPDAHPVKAAWEAFKAEWEKFFRE